MNRSPVIDDRLAELPIFRDLRSRDLRRLTRFMTTLVRPPGSVLLEQGAPGRQALIIVEGRASVRRGGAIVGTVGPGDLVGEISLLHDVPCTATVVTDTETTFEVLSRTEFEALLRQRPEIARAVTATAAARLDALMAAPVRARAAADIDDRSLAAAR